MYGQNNVTTATPPTATSYQVESGAFVFVVNGTANSDTGWVLITANPIQVDFTGASNLIFTQFTGVGDINTIAPLAKSTTQTNTLYIGSSSTVGQPLLSSGTTTTTAAYGALNWLDLVS